MPIGLILTLIGITGIIVSAFLSSAAYRRRASGSGNLPIWILYLYILFFAFLVVGLLLWLLQYNQLGL